MELHGRHFRQVEATRPTTFRRETPTGIHLAFSFTFVLCNYVQCSRQPIIGQLDQLSLVSLRGPGSYIEYQLRLG